ncbi:MAG: phosphate ABC transporter permease PstA [Pseudanabaena sp.]|jgi:phosphate transport system permease protein|nr:phosphate ABC transporter permease PstA [Pseudanabaena sp. M090S1SP2A07QC]MCA6507475.1 phosphate ABC transporter permease PstA [Pseudanabaena sp. M172S2SP2A07QC]MCA6523692.1 phosphate ABC transporter permease PstA [Pseudanabaena sp. M051S1SP2A07QC]MCA6528217.1 phosphate ABC transporter permease PstA [Pseudanabaena sp. M179S2SP2A07QC]MCA6531124.1 phosphate ABC transporter permease PstA [Pseudanabaena sp. M125S2SP2A07QC]MCA6534690.1 phosphate ABC transporter permease PstA [Pseudanabaena sp. M
MQSQDIQKLKANISRRKLWDYIFIIVAILSLLVSILTLIALILQLSITGIPRINWEFLTSFADPAPEIAGVLTAWVGSCLTMLVTIVMTVPIGIASGIYLEEYARKNWFANIIEINIANLAGIPSIIYGLLALGVFVQQLKLGESILTAGLTLSLLILPVVIVTTREALKSVPNSLREAAYAMGASKWQMIWDHLLPSSAGGILTGIIVGLSRAIGETAPLVTIGALTFIAFLPDSPFVDFPTKAFAWLEAPFTVMPIQMFNWVSRPEPEFQINAAGAGVILILMTLAMNGLAIYLRYYFRKRIKW